jgi:2-C-methyl-D-erythritol 2,4-cyclodiphosphate synthase
MTAPLVRVGIGHDTHRLAEGGPLRIGGVEIPHDQHLVGHSDADVLLHAITDAVLGAAGLGDIGQWYPDTDEAHRGRDSAEMLRETVTRLAAAGFRLVNVDCIVFAQQPKLAPYQQQITARLGEILNLDPSSVGVKAKTGEEVGPVGRCEAIVAQCVVLIQRTAT